MEQATFKAFIFEVASIQFHHPLNNTHSYTFSFISKLLCVMTSNAADCQFCLAIIVKSQANHFKLYLHEVGWNYTKCHFDGGIGFAVFETIFKQLQYCRPYGRKINETIFSGFTNIYAQFASPKFLLIEVETHQADCMYAVALEVTTMEVDRWVDIINYAVFGHNLPCRLQDI